jgi:tetratricopeptide (TPR) repeat protein
MKMHIFAATLLLLAMPSMLPASEESALRKGHEQSLEKAGNAFTSAQDDKAKADALRKKGVALNSLGRSEEALTAMDEALALSPGNSSIRMDRAIVLDSLGHHIEARKEWNVLAAEGEAARKDAQAFWNNPSSSIPSDKQWMDKLHTGIAMRIPSALNYIFLGAYDEAQEIFKRIISIKVSADRSSSYIALRAGMEMGDDAYYSERWLLWFAAYDNRGDSQSAEKALKKFADPSLLRKQLGGPRLKNRDAFTRILKRYYLGEVLFDDVLKEIDAIGKKTGEKESMRTEAHFFCAGYLRYAKHDEAAALAMLTEENNRPFNGSVERLFIKRELTPAATTQPSIHETLVIDSDPIPGTMLEKINVPSGLTIDDVRKSVLRSMKGRNWRIIKDAQGKATGVQSDVTMTMTYDERTVTLYGESKQRGGRIPKGWAEGLKKGVDIFMKRAAREK